MRDGLSLPGFGKRFTGRRNRPEAPHALARGSLVSRNEPARSLVAARGARDHEIVHDQRRRCGAVVLAGVSHHNVPQQAAGEPVQGQQVRIVSDQKDAVPQDRHTPVNSARRISGQPLRARPREAPDLAAAAGIECVYFIYRGHEHHAVHHDRCHLQLSRITDRDAPPRPEIRHVRDVDLLERAMPVAGQCAVISGPVAGLGVGDLRKGNCARKRG